MFAVMTGGLRIALGSRQRIQLHQKAVMDSLQDTPARVEALAGLSRFSAGLHACFTRRGDALFPAAAAAGLPADPGQGGRATDVRDTTALARLAL
jgi:hypothetical protein